MLLDDNKINKQAMETAVAMQIEKEETQDERTARILREARETMSRIDATISGVEQS